MPQYRISKSNTSSDRRKRLGDLIDRTGFLVMDPCSACSKHNRRCVVRAGYTNCGACQKRNLRCDGTFSQAKFDKLEIKKQELRSQLDESSRSIFALAQRLMNTQSEHQKLLKQLQLVTESQSAMVDREAAALGELHELAQFDGPDLFAFADSDPSSWGDASLFSLMEPDHIPNPS